MTRRVIEPREFERLKAAGRRMYEGGLVTGTSGAIGVRLPGGGVAVTAAGTRLGFMEPADILELGPNRAPVSPNGRKPAADAGTLAAVMGSQERAGSVIRSCSPYATALAHGGRRLVEEVAGLLEDSRGGVVLVPYYHPGTAGLAGAVAEVLRGGRVAVIESQGPVLWGTDVDDAVDLAEELEAAARVIFILHGEVR